MAKASYPGRTKTRLSPSLTLDEAAQCNTAFLKDIASNLLAAASIASIAPAMAFGPPGSEPFFRRHLHHSITLYEVWEPRFGDCLTRALRLQFEAGHRVACVLNSDSPTLPVSLLIEMARVMELPGDRAVLGPSTDGGYYLLACKTLHTRLFEDISWSTGLVAEQTLERAAEIGLPVHILPSWYDVDDGDSIKILMGELLERKSFSHSLTSSAAPHSKALLKALIADAGLRERLDVPAPALPEAVA